MLTRNSANVRITDYATVRATRNGLMSELTVSTVILPVYPEESP
jgi:hypothetical protein